MIEKYRDLLKFLDQNFGPQAERFILLLGYFLMISPIYCILVLMHLRFAGLKKSDSDIATTFLPLFIIKAVLDLCPIYLIQAKLYMTTIFISQLISLYVLIILILQIFDRKDLIQKISVRFFYFKKSFYQRRFLTKKEGV